MNTFLIKGLVRFKTRTPKNSFCLEGKIPLLGLVDFNYRPHPSDIYSEKGNNPIVTDCSCLQASLYYNLQRIRHRSIFLSLVHVTLKNLKSRGLKLAYQVHSMKDYKIEI